MNERGERVDVTGARAAPTGPRIQNFASNVASVLGPIVTGFLISATGSFVLALLLSGALFILGAITYLFGIKTVAPLPARTPRTDGAIA
jgi:hypothetical protein